MATMTPTPRSGHGSAVWPRSIGPGRIGWEPYVHLVWLAFLAFQPIFEPGTTAIAWWTVIALVIAFLPIYLWTWTRRGHSALPGIVALVLLGVGASVLNTGAAAFLIYASAAAGYKLRPRPALVTIVAITATVGIAAVVSQVPWPFVLAAFTPPMIFVPIIGGLNAFYGARMRTNARLRLAHDEVERMAAIAERERIARDLHDLLGHTLSVIVLKSELAAKLAEADPARATEEIRDVERISRRTLGEVREAVGRYRRRGLAAEIEEARSAFDAADVHLSVDLPERSPPPRLEGAMAMVLREALTNVLRHAGASRCGVHLVEEGGEWVLEVVDDGHGGIREAGSGLSGLRERIEALGGRVVLDGGDGTHLTAYLPEHVAP